MKSIIKRIYKKITKERIAAVLAICFIISCTEEIPLNTESGFESVIVIEAVITNEFKHQEILLTRSFLLEDESPAPENNASVKLLSSNGDSFTFQDTGSGVYKSTNEFQAVPDQIYTLEITTNDGKQYASSGTSLTQETQIDDLFVERDQNENGDEGVSIYINSFDPTNNSKYYRYQYEETYKVIAPLYSPQELIILNNDFFYPPEFLNGFNTIDQVTDFFFELQIKDEQTQICYNTVNSNTIILTDTNSIPEDRVERFRVRFLNEENYIISHRYSILVRQYVQSEAAHEYYKTLKEFSTSESILTENQIGFLEGNITAIQNPEEKVVGYFQVSSVDSRRIYFNYSDLYPGEPIPPFYVSCDYTVSPVLLEEDFAHNITNSPVIDALNSNHIFYQIDEYGSTNAFISPFSHKPFNLVLRPCGDCTLVGDNTVPDFWEE